MGRSLPTPRAPALAATTLTSSPTVQLFLASRKSTKASILSAGVSAASDKTVSASSVRMNPFFRTRRTSWKRSLRITRANGDRALPWPPIMMTGLVSPNPGNSWRNAADRPAAIEPSLVRMAAASCRSHFGGADASAKTAGANLIQAPFCTRVKIIRGLNPADSACRRENVPYWRDAYSSTIRCGSIP